MPVAASFDADAGCEAPGGGAVKSVGAKQMQASRFRSDARRAVFLDRDGVLNESEVRGGRPYAPTRLADFRLLPGVPEAVASLRAAGYRAIVVTNQKDVGAGITERAIVDAMHARLEAAVALDAIYVCTCTDECACYKPNPGMLLEAAERFDLDLSACIMIGDRWRDVEAGHNAGTRTVFIDRGYDESLRRPADHTVADLPAAARLILSGATEPVA